MSTSKTLKFFQIRYSRPLFFPLFFEFWPLCFIPLCYIYCVYYVFVKSNLCVFQSTKDDDDASPPKGRGPDTNAVYSAVAEVDPTPSTGSQEQIPAPAPPSISSPYVPLSECFSGTGLDTNAHFWCPLCLGVMRLFSYSTPLLNSNLHRQGLLEPLRKSVICERAYCETKNV